MMMRWKYGFWLGLLWMGGLVPALGLAQRDSVPHIVAGMLDWGKFKRDAKAPVFQQNDLAIYILRKDSLGELISQESSAAWIKDFHFVDINADRYIDAFYCGATKAKGGYHTYFMLADTGLRYPIYLDAPGYVHQLTPSKTGLEFILREDAHDKGYLHKITEYYFDFKTRKLSTGWQLQMLSTTEVPIMRGREAFALRLPTELRTTARVLNEPPADYDQNGKNESTGNVVAQLEPGLPLFRVAENEVNGRKWSFVVLLATPAKNLLFHPIKGVQMAYAGWILTEALVEGR